MKFYEKVGILKIWGSERKYRMLNVELWKLESKEARP